jgi:hypothetical protein
MNTRRKLRWHTILLIAALAIWVFMTTSGLIWFRILNIFPAGTFGLLDYYLIVPIPILIGLGAYLLFIQNPYRYVPFIILPFMYIGNAMRFSPAPLGIRQASNVGVYLAQYPSPYLWTAAFFAACAVYCFFLNKWDATHREPEQ